MHNLFKNVKLISCSTNIAASTAQNNGAIIDTMGFNGVAFVACLGALTTQTAGNLHAEGAATTASTDMVDLAGTAVAYTDAIQGALLALDLGRPKYRYVRAVAGSTAAANSALSAIVGLLYNPVAASVTHDTGTVANSTCVNFVSTGTI